MTTMRILMNDCDTGSCCLFQLSDHAPRVSSSCSSPKRERLSTVKKKTAVLKRAMTESVKDGNNTEWYGKAKSRWQQPAGEEGGQSSHDKWKSTKPQGKWKEISA